MEKEYPTEQELQASEVPTPETPEALADYIAGLVDRPHDYGTCVYAMSMAATAAFNYVAHKLGVSGFQASCADMDILRRTRRLERFMIIDLANALYPQYDLQGRLAEALEDAKPWLAEQAKARLADESGAHPSVRKHWEFLAHAA